MLVLFTADLQLGKSFKFKRNVEIGASERTIDLLKPVMDIADYAIEHGVKIVVICGDLYDRWTIHATIKKLFRKHVLIPLRNKGIEVLVIGGNHDSPQQLNAGCDIEDLVLSDKITVRRNLGTKIYSFYTGSADHEDMVGFIMMPFLTPETVFDVYMNADGKLKRTDYIEPTIAAEYISNVFFPQALQEINECDVKILIGHYHVLGTRASNMPDGFLDKEIAFNRNQVHENDVDLVVFGHIHAPQGLGDKIIVPGSTERMSFGERNEHKRFVVYDTTAKTWESVPLHGRKMVQFDFEFDAKETNPTGEILQAMMSADIEDALVKITIYAPPAVIKKVDYDSVEKSVAKAFHATIDTTNSERERDASGSPISIAEIANPERLMEKYIGEVFKDKGEEYVAMMVEKARAYMRG